MASPIFMSHPPPGFSILAIFRGIQLGFIGIIRSFKYYNEIWDQKMTEKLFYLLIASIIIQLLISLPIFITTILLRVLSFFIHFDLNPILDNLKFFQYKILNLTPFLTMIFKFFTNDFDKLFFNSMKKADEVYSYKHRSKSQKRDKNKQRSKSYYSNLTNFKMGTAVDTSSNNSNNSNKDNNNSNSYIPRPILSFEKYLTKNYSALKLKSINELNDFLKSYFIMITNSVVILILSKLPVVGSFVIPFFTFQHLNSYIGTPYSIGVLLITILFLNNHSQYDLSLINSILCIRTLLISFLNPYFKKLPFNKNQKDRWINNRIGILYGFGIFFYYLINIPFIGFVIYGLGEASSGYLITKITDEPPPIREYKGSDINAINDWIESECNWTQDYDEQMKEMIDSFVMPGEF
ncbi:hypothetical protein B5S33_g5305 [[Candida] boidinii]|nr:hypothetical protein B5S30_g4697 [[Candida] boidinii]OWB86600.1 hypothetical protein B5S33_g5305 [[Candida] boidinii]